MITLLVEHKDSNKMVKNGHRKLISPPSPTVIPKYDVTKLPKGLTAWSDKTVDPKVRQLMDKHFEMENIVIGSPQGTRIHLTWLKLHFSLICQDICKKN